MISPIMKSEIVRVVAVGIVCAVGYGAAADPALVPAPRRMTVTGGVYAAPVADAAGIAIRQETDAGVPAEGYRLSVTTAGVTVVSSDAAGSFYARQTLRQLAIGKGKRCEVPCVEIEDAPAYRWRGVLLDEGRHFFGKETIRNLLDLMAYHKLNVFHWHLTEDAGWRLDVPKYPELARRGALRPASPLHGAKLRYENKRHVIEYNTQPYGPFFYSAADVREIVAYAAERHITVVPEIEMPGHAGAALTAYPAFACRPEGVRERVWSNWGLVHDVFCLGNDDTIRFLEDVLDYVCELFPSKVIHIGGDECPRTRWRECPKCRARAQAEGLADVDALQAWLTRRIARRLESKGRRIMGWDEILNGDVPASAIGMSWRESAKNGAGDKLTTGAEAARRGHDMVMTPHTICYYDYCQGLPEDPYQYIGGNIPLKKAYSFDPAAGVAAADLAHVLGGQCNNWSEFTWNEYDLAWKMWPRTCAMAEALWTAPTPRDYAAFAARLAVHRRRLIAMGVNCAPIP